MSREQMTPAFMAEVVQASIETLCASGFYSRTHRLRQVRDQLQDQAASSTQGGDDFADWLAREMPPGTIIGDPRWWAPRILRQIEHFASSTTPGSTGAEVEPVSGPVAWIYTYKDGYADHARYLSFRDPAEMSNAEMLTWNPLYTAPPAARAPVVDAVYIDLSDSPYGRGYTTSLDPLQMPAGRYVYHPLTAAQEGAQGERTASPTPWPGKCIK